jgi:hypothetical protein
MVKGFLTVFPVYQFIVSSLMLNMAGLTLIIPLGSMESGVIPQTITDTGVTGQTLVGYELAIRSMALAAILNTLEKGMRLVQITRRQLRKSRRTKRQQKQSQRKTGYHICHAT